MKPTAVDQSEMELFEQPAESGQLWLNPIKKQNTFNRGVLALMTQEPAQSCFKKLVSNKNYSTD